MLRGKENGLGEEALSYIELWILIDKGWKWLHLQKTLKHTMTQTSQRKSLP